METAYETVEKVGKYYLGKGRNMLDFYERYLVPFAEMLTDMERRGIYVARETYLPSLQIQAERDKSNYERKFREWAKKHCDEADRMNLSSGSQKGTFFFGGGKIRIQKVASLFQRHVNLR